MRCSCKPDSPKEAAKKKQNWKAWKIQQIDKLIGQYGRAKTAGVKARIRRKINRHFSTL